MPNPTPQQSAILDAYHSTTGPVMIQARAGCGKTSTLELIATATPDTTPILFLCFNRAIATEAERRFRPITTVKTFNGLGHRIWGDCCGRKLNLNPNKILDIFKAKADAVSRVEAKELWREWDIVRQGVDLGRALGYVPSGHSMEHKSLTNIGALISALDEVPSPHAVALIDSILTESIRQAHLGSIDFTDQVYMPAVFGTAGLYPFFPVILVDEYQDLSPINHEMIRKLCGKSVRDKRPRQIGVGDDAQAIYAFRGATADSMDQAIAKFNMRVLPLSTSFRCPSVIVDNVRWRVPEFTAMREGGRIHHSIAWVNVEHGSAIICRNNAPLLHLAMKMLMSGQSVDVGGVDIGGRIIKLLTKLGPDEMTQAQAINAANDWEAEHDAKGSRTATDLAECMRAFILRGKSLGVAVAYAKHLFAQPSGTVHFTSGHKSKGLEWDHVYHLDNHLLALGAGQDPNLRYVIDTRAKESLTYIESEHRR